MDTTNTFEIVFCVAENTYMYLPIYLASKKGIFESTIKKHEQYKDFSIKVSFETPSSTDVNKKNILGGDKEAVEFMLAECSKENHNKLFIAIADPTSIFKSYENIQSKNDIKVIGQLINKFPFWIIGNYDPNDHNSLRLKFGELKNHSNNLFYCPPHRYITADACTHYILEELQWDTGNIEPRDFGNVVEECINNNSYGLTGELAKMAEECVANKISIKLDLAKITISDEKVKNIATVLIVDNGSCHKYKNSVLPAVLEAIQNAIFIIYSSPSLAYDACKYVSESYFGESENPSKINKIIEIINDDQLYPMALSIKAEDWINTIEFYLSQNLNPFDPKEFPKAINKNDGQKDYLFNLYKLMYDDTPSNELENNLIKNFGVTIESFEKEIGSFIERKKRENRRYIFQNYGKDIITSLLLGLIFLIFIVYIVLLFLEKFPYNNFLSHAGFLIGIIGLLSSYYTIKKEKKSSKTFKIK